MAEPDPAWHHLLVRIVVDTSREPLVVIRLPEEPSVEELERHFRDQIPPILHRGRIATVIDASLTRPLSFSSEHRQVAAKYYAQYGARFARCLVGEAYVLPSPVARGVLRVIQMISPPAWPGTIVPSFSEACAWCEARLRRDQKQSLSL